MFKSLLNVVTDVAEIVVAPVEVALDVTHAVTKPVADIAKEVTKDIKAELTDDHSYKG